MDRNFEDKFDVLFESNSEFNYLVLREKDCGSLLNYQVQMLLNNSITGLLKFNINRIGDRLNCFYNVTSKCSLVNFMSRKKFSRNEFLIMVLNITNNICCIKNYLLYDCNVLLDERYIYVEPEKLELYFVYLPFTAVKNDYRTFFVKLIVEMANFCSEDSDNYVQRFLEVIKSDMFNLSFLKTQLESLLKNDIKNQVKALENPTEGRADPLSEKRMERRTDKKIIERADKKSKASIPATGVKIPVLNQEKNIPDNPGLEMKAERTAVKADNRNIIKNANVGFVLLQPILLVAYVITVTGGFIDAGESKSITAIITLMIFVCVDILVFRLIRERYAIAVKGNVSGAVGYITGKMRAVTFIEKSAGNSSISGIEKNTILQKVNNQDRVPDSQNIYKGETEVIRKPVIKARAYLKETKGETVIELDKSSVLIGRMEGLVDAVVNSSAVGKIHAEVLWEEGNCYLIDCNSRNGTFVNDRRLVPNTRNKVINNDSVRFANREFKFFTSSTPMEAAV